MKRGIALELHRPARVRYKRRRVVTRALDDLWQADLCEMGNIARYNKGNKFILTVIDTHSKYAFAEPVLNKSGARVTSSFENVLKRAGALARKRGGRGAPTLLQTDKGKEFYNAHFTRLLKRYGIRHYSTHSNVKASIAERFNRTLKTRLYREFSARGSYRWLDILQDIVLDYNETKHRTIGRRPASVTTTTRLPPPPLKMADPRRHTLRIGDIVRISKEKTIFKKGYLPSWSTELFKVRKIRMTSDPVVLELSDMSGEPIAGSFYLEEVQKTGFPHHYLVERVLQRKGDKIKVRWLGFPPASDSLIRASDVV